MIQPANPDNADMVVVTIDDVFHMAQTVLLKAGLSPEQAGPVATVITAGQRDECISHGLYRLPGCVETIQSPHFVRDAVPVIVETSKAVVHADAGFGFSSPAFNAALPVVERKAREVGICVLAINRCFHFSALWPEIEAFTERGLAAIAMTPSHSWVAPAGGVKPALGTNPIAFGWPRGQDNPYIFDFATSMIARSDIALHKMEGKPIPPGWGVDISGQPTTSAEDALAGAMLTFGGYKGSALSTMIELLAGPLIGDMTSMESMAFDAGAKAAPCHGELIIVFEPGLLGGTSDHAGHKGAEALFAAIIDQGARLPSQRRYEARERSRRDGVRIPAKLYDRMRTLMSD